MPLEQYLRAHWGDIMQYLHYMLKVTIMATLMHLLIAREGGVVDRPTPHSTIHTPMHPYVWHGVPL